MRTWPSGWLIGCAGFLTAAVFVADLLLPLGVSVPLLYVVAVLLGLWSPRRRFALAAAAITTALTAIGGVLSPGGPIPWVGAINRPMTVIVLWTTALLVARYKTTEKALLEERGVARAYLDVAAVAMVALDREGRVALINRRGCEILGREAGEILGQPWFASFVAPGAREQGRALHHELVSGAREGAEHIESPVLRPDGTRRLVVWHTAVTRSADGRVTGTLSSGEDITERRSLEERLRKEQALAQVGQIAAVVAHEVRNPLAGIKGTLQIVAARLGPESRERAAIASILERIESLREMTEDLLVFSRPRSPRRDSVPIRALLGEAAGLLATDRKMAGVRVEVLGPDATVRGDPALLRRAFLNLLMNAAQAMGGSGEVRVSVERADSACRVAVQDRGPGVPEELRERVFEPFFTTKHRGTGLGLAIVKRDVEAHGGEVGLDCPRDGGTVVRVTLPLQDGGRESSPPGA